MVFAAQLEAIRDPAGDGQIGAQHAGIAENAQFGHPAMKIRILSPAQPIAFAEDLCDQMFGLHSLDQERPEVPVQRADVILAPQPITGADDDGLLPNSGEDTAQHLALAVQDREALFDGPDELQVIEHLQQIVLIQRRMPEHHSPLHPRNVQPTDARISPEAITYESHGPAPPGTLPPPPPRASDARERNGAARQASPRACGPSSLRQSSPSPRDR